MGAVAPARAEQLRLQAEVPDVPFLQLELARRMLALGQPAPAAAILRRELERRPADASVAADLTKAEMDMGRFVEARAAARRALNLDARDRQSRDRLVQINEVLALDPTQRGLPTPSDSAARSCCSRASTSDLLSCTATARRALAAAAPARPPAAAAHVPPADAAALSTAEILLEDEDAFGPSRFPGRADVQKPAGTTSSAATPVSGACVFLAIGGVISISSSGAGRRRRCRSGLMRGWPRRKRCGMHASRAAAPRAVRWHGSSIA